MKPYYQDSAVTIYHGDGEEYVSSFPKQHLLLTDPPYGLGIAANPFRQRHKPLQWDDAPVDASLLRSWISNALTAVVWGGNFFPLPPHQGFLVWDKLQPEDFSSSMCEQAWTNVDSPAKLFRKSVVHYTKQHPTQKPVELMAWCIVWADRQAAAEWGCHTILDPFMGSGTTLRAAKDLGRKAIGIEIEEKYCEIAAKRMAQEVLAFDVPLISSPTTQSQQSVFQAKETA